MSDSKFAEDWIAKVRETLARYDAGEVPVAEVFHSLRFVSYEETPAQTQRIEALARHYYNQKRYVSRLRAALEKIAAPTSVWSSRIVTSGILDVVEEALAPENAPPHPLRNFYKDGYHTGHPYPEYLDLPMRFDDDYLEEP
jgi:hypothetical protein